MISLMFVAITETVVVTFRILSSCVLVMRIAVWVIRPIPIVIEVVAPRRSAAVTKKNTILDLEGLLHCL